MISDQEARAGLLTNQVIGAAIDVHRALGPGLLESTYRDCLCQELLLRGVPFKREVPVPLEYKGVEIQCGFRLDVLVADFVLVELKAVSRLLPIHEAQLLTYLRLRGLHVGLLINFHVTVLRNGIKRLVNNL
jgi:GxxExxY protein